MSATQLRSLGPALTDDWFILQSCGSVAKSVINDAKRRLDWTDVLSQILALREQNYTVVAVDTYADLITIHRIMPDVM